MCIYICVSVAKHQFFKLEVNRQSQVLVNSYTRFSGVHGMQLFSCYFFNECMQDAANFLYFFYLNPYTLHGCQDSNLESFLKKQLLQTTTIEASSENNMKTFLDWLCSLLRVHVCNYAIETQTETPWLLIIIAVFDFYPSLVALDTHKQILCGRKFVILSPTFFW